MKQAYVVERTPLVLEIRKEGLGFSDNVSSANRVWLEGSPIFHVFPQIERSESLLRAPNFVEIPMPFELCEVNSIDSFDICERSRGTSIFGMGKQLVVSLSEPLSC